MFHFFNKKTLINDEFIQDIKSLLKLYPKQSFSAKPTKTNSGFKIPKAIADELSDNGGEIEIFFKHDLANIVSGFLIGRENLLPVNGSYGTFGFYLATGKSYYFFYCDGSAGANCVIPVSSLTDGAYYIAKLTVAATLSFTLQKVTKTGNLNTIGTAINSTTTPKGVTKVNADMGVFAGCFSSGSLNYGSKHEIVYIKFKNNLGICISETYMCNGNANQVTDICNGVNYEVLNEDNFPSFWNHKQDYSHYNFRYGHTLYYNSSLSLYLRVPNKEDGTEIIPASVTAGYTRISNYQPCRLAFNQCENVFKLDDVANDSDLYNADPDFVLFTESTGVAKEIDLKLFNMSSISDRGYLYYNETLRNNFMLYKNDKTLLNDVKIIKYIGMSSRITYTESGVVEYDENNHTKLTEV